MVKARTWFTLFIISLGTVAATASCGSDEATGGGTGGVGGGILGASGRAGSVGRAGSLGASGAATETGTGTLGSMCGADSDCDAGLTCVTADSTTFVDGGPSLGMCTLTCATDADCSAVEPGAGCINVGTDVAPAPYCFEGCTQGGDSTSFDTKCQGRPDFACTDFSSGSTPDPFCVPQCRADVECGTGLFCNKHSGLCSKTKNSGDKVGAPCDPQAATDTCEGHCISTADDDTKGFCAEICSGFLPCMYTGTTPGGLCSGALSNTFGPVDRGFCEPNCACTSDCPFPGDLCRQWPTAQADFKTALGADGMCYPSLLSSVELTCEGGASGTSGAAGEPGTSESAGAGGVSGAGN